MGGVPVGYKDADTLNVKPKANYKKQNHVTHSFLGLKPTAYPAEKQGVMKRRKLLGLTLN